MRFVSIWKRVFGLDQATVLEGISFDEEVDAIVAEVRVRAGRGPRCGRCGARAPRFDRGDGRRRWRALDLGVVRCYVEADAPRVACRVHGPTVIQVPWARHAARATRAFEDQIAWLATRTSKAAVGALMRTSWRTVGGVVARVVDAGRARRDPLDGLRRIGIDEIGYRRGQRYLTVVVDHDTGRLIWAAPGHDDTTLRRFFDALGPARCAQITHVSVDAARLLGSIVPARCPAAAVCIDPFHVVKWANFALDEVRRKVWNTARRHGGDKALARHIKGCRYALLKNPEHLTGRQQGKLAAVEELNQPLYRAYLLKEQLRLALKLPAEEVGAALDRWTAWARSSELDDFTELAARIERHRDGIAAAQVYGLSNALVESTNTKLRLLIRLAFGFARTDHLIALCYLDRGGYQPPLPGRAT